MPRQVLLFLLIVVVIVLPAADGDVPHQRPTLPPTWTPTFTPTITPTRTPTLTPSPTNTLSPAAFCETYFFVRTVTPGHSFPYSGTFAIVAGSELPEAQTVLDLTHRLSGKTKVVEIPQRGFFSYEIPVRLLPDTGLIDWRARLVGAGGETVCEQGGYFFVGREEWLTDTPIPTEPPPVTIITATPGPTQTPYIIVVTATPEPPSIRERSSAPTAAVPPTAITPDG